MKLTCILLVATILQVSAASYAQNINLQVKNAALEDVLATIKKQSGYDFLYGSQLLKTAKPVTLSVKNGTINEVLKKCFADQPLNFLINQKTVTIREKEVTESKKEVPVSGKVSDDKGETIIGVSIKIKGSTRGVVSDINGNYTISVPDLNAVLVFSYVGFGTKELALNGRNRLDVILEEKASALEAVVVVGYGTQKRSEITGSIGSIKADQIDQFASGSINTSLQGKIAGLQVTTNSGEPGAGANISLRGVSSINGNSSPLIIIDGVPVNNDSYTSVEDGASFSPLNDINPADIESIEVLKDAATASIYGSRASNGVMIITTKTGQGKDAQINFSAGASLVDITRKIGIMNSSQWRQAYGENLFNAFGTYPSNDAVIDSLSPLYNVSNNWQDIMYRQTLQYKADISISGSSKEKNVNYYVSAGYKDLKPIILNSKYTQMHAASRLNYKVNKRLSGSTNFNFSSNDYNRLNTGNNNSSVIFRFLVTMPVYNAYDNVTGEIVPLFPGNKVSPLALSAFTKNNMNRLRLLGKQEFSYNILKGLDFKTNVSVDYSNTESNFYQPPILNTIGGKSIYSIYSPSIGNTFVNENTLTWKKKVKKNNFNLLLGESYQLSTSKYSYIRGIGSVDNIISTIGGTATITTHSQTESEYILQSFFSRLNYNYASKYLASVLIRRDGSSRFGEDNRYGYFPSASVGWLFSKESFMQKYNFLESGKLRASYGITGNQNIGNYSSLGSYSATAGSYLGDVAIVSNALPNADLKWETTKQLDIGTDLSFFKGRVNLTADYYIKNTSDLLMDVLIPSQKGYNSIPFNFGSIRNSGFDLQLDGTVMAKKSFKWSTIITVGLNRNKVTALPNSEDYFAGVSSLARVGYPIGVFYGLKATGVYARDEDNVYQTNTDASVVRYRKGSAVGEEYKGGDVIYNDLNGDGIINDDDLQVIGNPTPNFFGGLQNSFSYKKFTASVFVNYVIGNEIFNNIIRTADGINSDANFSANLLRRWRKQGDVTDIPKVIKGDPMQNYAVSSRFVEDGSFIRVQNIALGYTISPRYLRGLGVKAASVGLSVQNLLTFGTYSGYDPEVSGGSSPFEFGVDNGAFPKTRNYSFSVNFKF